VVPLDSKLVSRRHATIRVTRGEAFVEDLGSKNGTYLGGTEVVIAARGGYGSRPQRPPSKRQGPGRPLKAAPSTRRAAPRRRPREASSRSFAPGSGLPRT
jgi:hypothetical protein